ncbi:MAG: hypothetical protein KDA24_30190, partial [Deltaproteobacteria bacterium]|nr:hypothetical protein [Deltaproteobacteria bacterium]
MPAWSRFFAATALFAAACSPLQSPDGIDEEAFMNGDLANVADCQAFAVLDLLNAPSTDALTLKEAGVHTRAANNLVAARNGADELAGTEDDVVFVDLFAVDDVPYVGPSAMGALLEWGLDSCDGLVDPPAADDTCIEDEVVAWVNVASADAMKLEGVHTRAANNLVTHRDGPDAVLGTADDALFTSLEDIDAVSYVGPSAMEALRAYGIDRCSGVFADVVFSPRPYQDSHLTRVVELLEAATGTLDVAMYSMSDASAL